MTSDTKKFLKIVSVSIIVIILLEIFIFNFSSFLSLFDNDKATKLNIENAYTSGITYFDATDDLIVPENTDGYIIIRNIDSHISSIYMNARIESAESEIKFSYNEGTNTESLRTNGRINLIQSNEHSKYTLCSFAGETDTLKFYFSTDNDEVITIDSIEINKNIPLNISPLRISLLFFLTVFILALTTLDAFKTSIDKNYLFKTSTAAVLIIFLSMVLLLSCFASRGLYDDFTDPKTNQINKELVDAFEAGQVHLLQEVEDEILALENPYDWSQRVAAGIKGAWDHCLYNGHYYSYYGIAPVLLLFLPYHLITGLYFPSVWAIFIFSFIGVLFLGMTYYKIITKFSPKLPLNIAIIGLIITELSCGIWFSVPVDKFYEIAQSSGFAFIAMGAYFLISSNAVSNGKLSRVKAALSSVFLALSVLCRPTLAVYCVASLIFIGFGAKKAFSEKKGKSLATYLISALLPYVLIGSIQMIYNYLRFDSFFDFGIQYSLTINDFTATEFHIPQVIIGFYNFIFAPPIFNTEFPFAQTNYNLLGVNGYYYSANKNAIGILFRALPVFAYIFSRKAYLASGKNKKALLLLSASCVIAPAVIIFSIWESGYGVRYCADFSWQILIGALIIAFHLYEKVSPQIKRIADKIMIISLIAGIIVNFSTVYSYVFTNSSTSVKATMLSFARLFEFWNIM